MRRAVVLAKKGMVFTYPNPCVGAVVVKGGVVVGEGYHSKAGEDHAEVIAIKNVMNKSGIKTVDLDPTLFHNAVLYVTLEPCAHSGKTPPCVKAITAAGFKKVCVGMKDPFNKVNGKGIKYMRGHGIDVEICRPGSILSNEIKELNQPFIKWALTHIPYVILKSGMSLDGKIALKTGQSKWITSEILRKDGRMERSKCNCVIVGANTVKADDPELAKIGKYKNTYLLKVVVDGKLSVGTDAKIFKSKNVLVACCDSASSNNKKRFKASGIPFKSFGKDFVSIKRLLQYLGKIGLESVFVEGGSEMNGAIFDAALKDRNLMDKVIFYIAPKLIGGRDSKSVIGGEGIEKLSDAVTFDGFFASKISDGLKVTGVINFY